MKRLILLLIILALQDAIAQRIPTDAVTLQVTSTNFFNSSNAFFDIQRADGNNFWLVSLKHFRQYYSISSLGDIRIEKRNNQTLSVISSIEMYGKGCIFNIESDEAGNLYLSGFLKDSLTFANAPTLYSPFGLKYFLMKVSPTMQVEWVNDVINAEFITVSPDGNHIYARGLHGGFAGNVNFYRLNTQGQVTQTKTFNGVGYLASFKTNNSGELYFAGGCLSKTAQLDTVDASHNFSYTSYYGKASPNLTAEWIKIYDDITCDDPYMDLDSAGNLLYYGPLRKSGALDNISLQANGGFDSDFLLTSTSPTGQVAFYKDTPPSHWLTGTHFRGVSTMHDRSAIVLFQKNIDTVNWGNGFHTYSTHAGSPIILEYNTTTGDVLTANSFPIGHEKVKSLLYLPNGDLLVTGTTLNTLLYTTTDTLATSSYNFHIKRWVMPSITSISDEVKQHTLSIYPNPSTGIYSISEPMTGIVYTLAGQQILSITQSKVLDLSRFDQGMYILRTDSGNSYKLLKQ